MPTEQEMVKIIAERVMWWKWASDRSNSEAGGYFDADRECRLYSRFYFDHATEKFISEFVGFNPFTSWADAGMVFDRLREICEGLAVSADKKAAMCVIGRFPNVGNANDASGPRAISLAAYEWAMQQEKK